MPDWVAAWKSHQCEKWRPAGPAPYSYFQPWVTETGYFEWEVGVSERLISALSGPSTFEDGEGGQVWSRPFSGGTERSV